MRGGGVDSKVSINKRLNRSINRAVVASLKVVQRTRRLSAKGTRGESNTSSR